MAKKYNLKLFPFLQVLSDSVDFRHERQKSVVGKALYLYKARSFFICALVLI